MTHILLVEDSKSLAGLVKEAIEKETLFSVLTAFSFSEAQKLVAGGTGHIFLAVLDYHLPDAPDGEIIDFIESKEIPVIVFTSDIDDNIRDKIWSKQVIDYIFKEGITSIDYLVTLISRVHRNKEVKVLVVDDSLSYRNHICTLLKTHMYEVFEAESGKEALDILSRERTVKLVLTDFHMPEMDGFKLLRKIRQKYSREDVAVIGMSAHGAKLLAAKFIKYGSNDFMNKPFLSEEFYCRVTQNMDMLKIIEEKKNASNIDFLTGLFNRRYAFDLGPKVLAGVHRNKQKAVLAMIDIDFFKKVNDTYGHDAGDVVLKQVACLLHTRFRESDIVARLGGEEFCVLATNINPSQVAKVFEEVRKEIENREVCVNDAVIRVTVSIGVCDATLRSMDDMIKQADIMLYKAKELGRNQVACYTKEGAYIEDELTALSEIMRLSSKFIMQYGNDWDVSRWMFFYSGLLKKGFVLADDVRFYLFLVLEHMKHLYHCDLSPREVEIIITALFEKVTTHFEEESGICTFSHCESFIEELYDKGLQVTDDVVQHICNATNSLRDLRKFFLAPDRFTG